MEKQGASRNGCGHVETRSPPQDQTTEKSKEVKASDESASDIPGSYESVIPGEDAHKYLAGFKLVLVMSTVTMVAFLILLDSAIIATVRQLYCEAFASSLPAWC
jgi:hypothetical protein